MDPLTRDTRALLQDLVGIASVNPCLATDGAGEDDIVRYVAGWCRDNGLAPEVIDDGDGRPNVLASSCSSQAAPTLLLCGHLDTVGFGSMTDPLVPRIDGDRLHGRGAYDMKSGLAAALIACREAARQDLDARVLVAAVADEEHGSIGIQRVLHDLEADAAIVTEPTEMAIGIAHKGFVWTEIEVIGVAAHGSRPQFGVDAIVKAGPLLTGLDRLNRTLADRPHPLLGPATVHASLIAGGQEPSTIPERCRLTIEHRTLPGQGVVDIEASVADLLADCGRADPEFRADARTLMHRPAMETSTDHPLVGALGAAHGDIRGTPTDVVGMSYWADSAFIADRGIPTVLFGPGGEGAHADTEWVSLSDTADCARILLETARSIGGAWGG